jgi:hypothetical protein
MLQNFTIVWPCIVTYSLWIKPTDALNSSFIGITTLHVSGRLSAHHQEFLAVHRIWYILCWILTSIHLYTLVTYLLELFQHKMYQSQCTAKNSWWWAEKLPETCRVVIPIKLEFSASVGFIHKDVTEFSRLYTIRLYFSTFSLFRVVSVIPDYTAANIYKIFSE